MSQNTLLDSLTHLTEGLSTTTTPEQLLSTLVGGARSLLPFTACALALKESEGWRVWRATASRPKQVALNTTIPPEAVDTLDRFISHGQPLQIDDLLSPPWSDASHRGILWKDGTRSALLVPLIAGGATLGALSFTSTQPDQYPTTNRNMVTLLTWMAAATLRALPQEEEAR
ncbi:MAG: GAF domain-containing protein [Ardenticatenales bacterium]|nr:GAF domain-containing protein [Ardenticatenales bacterium]